VRSRARGRSRIIWTETRVRIAPTNQRALLIHVGICPRNHPLPHALSKIGPGKPGIMYGVHLYIARSTLIIAEVGLRWNFLVAETGGGAQLNVGSRKWQRRN